MVKRLIAVISLLALMLCASGCKISIEDVDMPNLPQFDLTSTINAEVESIIGNQCMVLVTEGDGTYDEETRLLVTYDTVAGDLMLEKGSIISVTYDYIENVSSVLRYEVDEETYRNLPNITVEEITVLS